MHPCYSPRFVINISEHPPEPSLNPVLPVNGHEFIPRCAELPVSPELPVFEGHHKFLLAKYRSRDWQLVPPKRSSESEGFGKRHCDETTRRRSFTDHKWHEDTYNYSKLFHLEAIFVISGIQDQALSA